MNTLTQQQQPAIGKAPVDDGLRSVQGIRWLLLAGGLVVAVSVIRLVAAEWGALPDAARFLTLAAGALTLFAAGDVTRRRLCLPVAGSALLFLAAALVPLLAWGAAYLRLLEAPFGWPSLILGLGALLAASDRAMRGIFCYRGATYTLASGVMLFALPILPYLDERWPWNPALFFLIAASSLGLLLRSASRNVNRFFFHRDRRSGIERPVHWLPFAMLILLYGAGMSLLAAFATHLAVPLVFIAIALIDAGEEYYRALIRATGERPERWPRRSLALLALGFTSLAASLATATLDPGRHSLALVASIASLRLILWACRYKNTAAHAIGLVVGIVAYHAFPVLVPDLIREYFQLAVRALGINPRGAGALSLGDLGMLAQLLALAWIIRRQLTPAMQRAHAVVTAAGASLMLLIGLTDPSAARLVAPAAALLLAGGVFALRFKALIPALYQALATAAVAWAWSPELSGAPLSTRAALYLGAVHLLFLGAGLGVLRRDPAALDGPVTRLLTWPPLAVAWALLLRALWLSELDLGAAGILTLVATATFFLSALISHRASAGTRGTWLFGATSLGLAAGAHCLAVSAGGDPTARLAIVSQVLMVAYWLGATVLKARDGTLARSLAQAARLGFVICAEVGLLWLTLALAWGTGAAVEACHLVLLAGLLIADELRIQKRLNAVADGWSWWRLKAALATLFVWVPIQVAGIADREWLTLAAMGWLVFAVATRAAAETLQRRDRGDLAPVFLISAMIGALAAGAASILATLGGAGSPWMQILPGFLASAFFVFMAFDGYRRRLSAILATGYFAVSSWTLLMRLETWGPELYCLGPGLALLGLSGLLRRELDDSWRQRLFTAGATLLYAMPVLGLLDELDWGWQIVLLLFAVAFGTASFKLRSRSLLIVSTAALFIDLACFLIKLRQTAPLLVWVAGIVFGLGLMAIAALLEHRREVLLQHIRIWGRELRSWGPKQVKPVA